MVCPGSHEEPESVNASKLLCRTGRVAQMIEYPEFKPQYHQKKKKIVMQMKQYVKSSLESTAGSGKIIV
jgi:hypothetical protein